MGFFDDLLDMGSVFNITPTSQTVRKVGEVASDVAEAAVDIAGDVLGGILDSLGD